MSLLLSSFNIKSIHFKNRLVISPMCQYTATEGFANDWHLVHLGSRAVGGAGLIIQEATAVSPEGRITIGDVGLYNDEQIEPLQKITAFIKAQGAVPGIQLAHAGRKASCDVPWKKGKQIAPSDAGGWHTVAPSAIPFYDTDVAPHALDEAGILKVINDFKNAAARALIAGYQVLEIHAAHGYLLHQFLSPLSNKRTDAYGGNFENNSRLLLQVVKAIQTVWPNDLPLFVRISATDWADGGWDEASSIALATILKNEGIDVIDCSSGGLVPHVKIPVGAGYQVPFAAHIKKQVGIATGAVGMITTAQQAEAILQAGEADLIFIARTALSNPYFGLHAAKELGDNILWPNQYDRAFK
ncbi:NADH:flavin oxidoreductase/NADH oxidase [Ferruginibacter yonginensis]|uniref:NADH:flavin oxidoreductase/NADH oxidase n=1 Tax=Ferruginibacter yonginensis TaxID=1310416 RepID=A0ABV8QVX4_9BACT